MLTRMSGRGGWRGRAWIAIPIALLFVLLFVWSSRERAERSGASSDDGADGFSARASEGTDAGTSTARVLSADAGASAIVAALPPVRLSAPVVRRDASTSAGELRGRVLAFATGRPIAGAELGFAHGGATQSVRTDERGEFTFAPSEAGTYVLALATADGFLPFAPEWGHSPIRFAARPGVHLEGVVVYLVDAIEYFARIVDAEDRPVEGARLHVFGAERGERALAPISSDHVSDARGEARFSAPDGAVLEASSPLHGRGRARVDAAVQVSRTVTIRLSREGASSDRRIAGRVLGPSEEAIEGALIVARHTARPSSAEGELHPPLEATTDDRGRFVLEGADAGSYRLVVTAAGFARLVHERVESGTEDLVLHLAHEGRIVVRARDAATHAPVPALTVVITRAIGPLAEETLAIESSYDAEGQLEIGGLPPGPCAVLATSPGYALSAPVRAVISASSEPAHVEIELDRGGTITGRVVSEEGRGALEGARATLEGAIGSGASAVPLESSALTDAEGRFTLAGVPPGVRSVAIWAADHHGRLRSGLVVARGETLDLGEIDLAPVGEGERPQLELAGIGAVLSAEGDAMVIGRVIEGGGAAERGLVPGDAILEVEGVPVVDLGFAGTIERIRGPEGTEVRLRVRREDGSIEQIAVPRRRVRA